MRGYAGVVAEPASVSSLAVPLPAALAERPDLLICRTELAEPLLSAIAAEL